MTKDITFDEFDKLGRESFAHRITTAINIDIKLQTEAYVLLLNGKFGAGKTTFLKMWISSLQEQGYDAVYINSLSADYEDNAIIPILQELHKISGAKTNKLKASIKKLLPYTMFSLTTFAGMMTSTNIISATEDLIKLKVMLADNAEKISVELLETLNKKSKAIDYFKACLAERCRSSNDKPMFIFIDELDRVSPDYAIKYLNTIKHFFSVPGVVFVIAADRDRLLSTISHLYGSNNTDGYLLKFLTREATLIKPSIEELYNFIIHIFSLTQSKKTLYSFQEKEYRLKRLTYLADAFELSLRELEMVFKYVSALIDRRDSADKGVNYGYIDAAFLLICIYVKDYDICKKIATDTMPVNETMNYLDCKLELIEDKHMSHDVRASMLFCIQTIKNQEFVKEYASKCKDLPKMLDSYRGYFSYYDINKHSIMHDIYIRIQNWFGVFDNMK